MGQLRQLIAYTDLSLEEIQAILFDGIDIEEDPTRGQGVLQGNGFRCTVGLSSSIGLLADWTLGVPENLDVTFYFGWDIDSFVNSMKIVMNWFRKTAGYSVYLHHESILLLRMNKKIIRNSSEYAWIPDEAIELIDTPHEVKDLGIL